MMMMTQLPSESVVLVRHLCRNLVYSSQLAQDHHAMMIRFAMMIIMMISVVMLIIMMTRMVMLMIISNSRSVTRFLFTTFWITLPYFLVWMARVHSFWNILDQTIWLSGQNYPKRFITRASQCARSYLLFWGWLFIFEEISKRWICDAFTSSIFCAASKCEKSWLSS